MKNQMKVKVLRTKFTKHIEITPELVERALLDLIITLNDTIFDWEGFRETCEQVNKELNKTPGVEVVEVPLGKEWIDTVKYLAKLLKTTEEKALNYAVYRRIQQLDMEEHRKILRKRFGLD